MRPDGVCVGMNTSLLRSPLNYRALFSFFLDFLERIMVDSFCSMGDKEQTQRGYPVELKIFLFVFCKMAIEPLLEALSFSKFPIGVKISRIDN